MAPGTAGSGVTRALWWVALAGALTLGGALAAYALDAGGGDDDPATATSTTTGPTSTGPTSTGPDVTVNTGLGPFRAFLVRWMDAQVAGDVAFLLGSLDDEVVARYGEQACRAHLADLVGTVAALEVVNGAPRAFAYSTDGRSVDVADAWELSVALRSVGEDEPAFTTMHLRPSSRGVRWFTDCGVPLATPG